MKTALYWRPDYKEKNELSQNLKHLLAKYLWDQDGSLTTHKHKISEQDKQYLQELAAIGILEAGALLRAVEEYKDVLVWIGD